jgi:hypothetical protein
MIGQGPRQQWRNLSLAAGAAAAALFAGWDLYLWVQAYVSDHFHNDFTFYVAAARIGISRGWPSIYDLAIQQAELDAMGSNITIAQLARFISPPPLAWLAVPFAPMQYEVGYWAWSALLLAALTWTWYLAAPGSGLWRLVHLAAAIGWLPIIFGLQLGQPPMLVALGVAAGYALLRAGRPFWAGMALGALVLKPQLAFLVPMALLVSGRIRAFWGSVVALGCLAAASALALGPSGISTYQGLLNFAATVPVNRELTLAPFVGDLAATRVIQVVIALWALFLAFQLRKRSHEWVLIPALVGGMLATPYLHLDDLAMLGLAGWLYLRTSPPGWTWLLLLGLVVAAEAIPFVGALPLIAGELALLVLLSVAALKAHDRDPEHHQPEGQHDARLERDREHVAVDGQP